MSNIREEYHITLQTSITLSDYGSAVKDALLGCSADDLTDAMRHPDFQSRNRQLVKELAAERRQSK